MSLPAIAMLIGVGVLVAGLAFYLIAIALVLRKTLFTLGTVHVGLRAIADRVEPVQDILSEITDDLQTVHEKTEQTAGSISDKEPVS